MRHPNVRAYYLSDGTERWLYAAADLDAIITAVEPPPARDREWDQHLARVDCTIRQAWATTLHDSTVSSCGAQVVDTVIATVAKTELLWLGASNTIRDAALVAHDFPATILSNRGTAGIDGTIASAIGVALAQPDRHVTAVLGDLTFLYDATALQFGHHEQKPGNLTLIVINDQGGGIFELLEQGSPEYKQAPYATTFERIYGTPQDVSIDVLCQAYGIRHRTVTITELPHVLRDDYDSGPQVIEVRTGREHLRGVHARARRCTDARLSSPTTPASTLRIPQGDHRP